MSRSAPTVAERSSLASLTAHRQGIQLAWSLAGALPLLLGYLIALGLEHADWVTHQFPQTVLWCALPYLLTGHLLYRGAGLPSAERRSLLVVTTAVPFLLTPLGFALLQQPYSRGAVLLVYGLSTAWYLLGMWLHRERSMQRLVCLDPGIAQKLQALVGAECLQRQPILLEPWPAGGLVLDQGWQFDGVVLDRQVQADAARTQLLSQLKLDHVRLYSIESVAEMLSGRKVSPAGQDELWQIDGNPAYDVAKRCIDLVAVLLTVPLWLSLSLVVGLAVKLDSPGPALFRQQRVGRNGRSFCLLKFRSMVHQGAGTPARFAQRGDDRITRVGRVIRRWRLDELPQLWNVLGGEMSLIGPRPEQTQFVQGFASRIAAYPYRHLVRPGLTGWAQVQQGYAGSEEETVVKLSYDLYYVAHYSVALDLLIAYKTVRTILTGFGSR
ncbi:sugar transferase [Ramlibacter tataouinensis]|nr:sugar transferase [Ramlibacter tataouinensis]